MSDLDTTEDSAPAGTPVQERWVARVLPASPGQWIALILAAIVLSGSVGYAFASRQPRPARDSVAVGFLFDMIDHHDQALQMAMFETRNGADPNVAVFAHEILRQQSFEIGMMTQKLAEWSYARGDTDRRAMRWMGDAMPADEMPGMASPAELDALGNARGDVADALFIRLMQDHHRGGAQMADYAAARTSNAFVKDLATRMANVQRQEIREMEAARKRGGLPSDPPAWTPAFGGDAAGTSHGEHG